MTMTELKPCPFCGGKASLTEVSFCLELMQFECADCGTRFFMKDDIWNHRVYPPEVQQAIERMKQKKVVCRHFNKYYGNEIGDCPNCLCTIEDESELNEHPHCKYCGQALDWSEE